jgi:hypothetical protein
MIRKFAQLIGTAVPAIIAALTLFTAGAQEKQSLQDVYSGAVKQFDAGQYQQALQGFQTVLKHQPNFVYARNYAAKCIEAIRKGGGNKQNLDAKLAAIILPSVSFEGTDLGLVFEYLTQKSEELSDGKVVANFIYKGTDDQKKNSLVTLSLRNTPFTDVIRYVGQLTNTEFKYEEFAIVAAPVGSAPAAPEDPAKATALESKFDPPARKTEPFPQTPQSDPFSKR